MTKRIISSLFAFVLILCAVASLSLGITHLLKSGSTILGIITEEDYGLKDYHNDVCYTHERYEEILNGTYYYEKEKEEVAEEYLVEEIAYCYAYYHANFIYSYLMNEFTEDIILLKSPFLCQTAKTLWSLFTLVSKFIMTGAFFFLAITVVSYDKNKISSIIKKVSGTLASVSILTLALALFVKLMIYACVLLRGIISVFKTFSYLTADVNIFNIVAQYLFGNQFVYFIIRLAVVLILFAVAVAIVLSSFLKILSKEEKEQKKIMKEQKKIMKGQKKKAAFEKKLAKLGLSLSTEEKTEQKEEIKA